MRNFKIFSLSLIFIINSQITNAQQFLKTNPPGKRLSFVELQKRFSDWAKTTDLKSTKHWKYYKRWEHDMLMKTNGHGELADAAIYINEAVKVAQQKQIDKSSRFSTAAWSPVGPFTLPGNETGYMQNGIGRINCIAFHPTNASTYFVGVAQGGLWKTTNNGSTWTPLTDNLPITRISDIVIDPNNPNIMYISLCDFEYVDVALNIDGRKRNTHYGLGVYKTTDGGLTWAPTGLTFQLTNGDASLIRKILINPANSNQLVAAGVNGMYRSLNGGVNWTRVLDTIFWDLQPNPSNPNVLYAASGWFASSNIGYAAIYKSNDFGATWTKLNTGIPTTGTVQRIRIAVAHADTNYVYAMAVDANDGSYGIYKSTNAGGSWTYINPGVNMLEAGTGTQSGGQGTYDLGFTVNYTNKNILYVGGVNIWASTNGGTTFNPASHWTLKYGPTIHGDIHFIETQPLTGNIFVCSDGGLYRTSTVTAESWSSASAGTPWPTSWTTISNGMAISSFYRISSSRNTTGRLAAGAQDNGTFYYDGTAWNTIFGGDGMDNYLDPQDDNVVIGSSQFGSYQYSSDGGLTGADPGANVNSEPAEWTSPLTADYHIPGTMYAGFTNASASYDGGNTWFALSPMPTNPIHDNEMTAIAVAYSNSNVIYGTRRIRFEYGSPSTAYRTTDAGNTWTDITSNLPDSLYYTSVEVSQSNANTAYLALAGLTPGVKVYKTTNGGASWQNISYNLPNAPVNCVKTVPGTGEVLVATDFGVYMLDSLNSNWISENTGLPNVITSDIEFNVALNKMYVATFGRGIWESAISSLTGIKDKQSTDIGIELYPSPNNGSFNITISDKNKLNETLNLEIVDITGRLVYSTVLSGQATYKQVLDLPSGMYFAKIKSKSMNGVKSFIVKE